MSRTRRVIAFVSLVGLIAVALAPGTALGHRLNVFAYVEGTQVKVEAYFSDGVGAKHADVQVYGAADKQLVEGEANEKGEYAFELPAGACDLRIVVTAGEGHRGQYTLKAEELEGLGGVDEPEPVEERAGDFGVAGGGSENTSRALSRKDLDEIRNDLARIDAALRNVQRQLAELRRPRTGPSLESVMAGLGFIVGLTGIAMYFMARSAMKKARRAGSQSTGD